MLEVNRKSVLLWVRLEKDELVTDSEVKSILGANYDQYLKEISPISQFPYGRQCKVAYYEIPVGTNILLNDSTYTYNITGSMAVAEFGAPEGGIINLLCHEPTIGIIVKPY